MKKTTTKKILRTINVTHLIIKTNLIFKHEFPGLDFKLRFLFVRTKQKNG